MTGFDEREKGYERKFQRDQELAFKVAARRNRLLGLWAAEHLGLSGKLAEAYAREVVAADLERPGTSDLIEKISRDFAAKGVALDTAHIELELGRCTAEAKRQLGVSG